MKSPDANYAGTSHPTFTFPSELSLKAYYAVALLITLMMALVQQVGTVTLRLYFHFCRYIRGKFANNGGKRFVKV